MLAKVDRGITEAELTTLNDTGLYAADLDRATIVKTFTNRNKWTENSVFPRKGRKLGFVPVKKKTSKNAYVRVGSIQPYMRDQEMGWTANNPQVPTNQARVGGNYRKRIKKAASLPHLRAKGAVTAKNFRQPRTRKKKIDAMIGMVNAGKFQGVIQIRPQDPTTLPPGYYKVMRRKTLTLWRLSQWGARRRKATKWHSKTMRNPRIKVMNDLYYKRNAARILRRSGVR
jgi:hypothetical protein